MVTRSETSPETAGIPLSQTQEISQQVGSARVTIRVEAPPGTRVKINLESQSPSTETATGEFTIGDSQSPFKPVVDSTAILPRVRQGGALLGERLRVLASRTIRTEIAAGWANWEVFLFALALLVYLITRIIRLPDFPIYFFTDEAVQTILAQDLVRDGMRGGDGLFLPTFFVNGYQYNLGTSVYLQLLPYLFFGTSVWVTRGISVLVTLLAAVCVGLTLKNIFHLRQAWLAVLLLSITPAWFLHSRTAFETSLAATFFAAFIYFYLRYRTGSPRHLYAAVVMGALMFYSYSPARMIAGVAAVLLLLSDLAYHWQQRRIVGRAFGLTLLLALPLLRFQIMHPEENVRHLSILNSYWIQNISTTEKLGLFFREYLRGLNPFYWFLPNDTDLPRHLMKGYGHVLGITFPVVLLGLGIVLKNIRSAAHRVLLIALLAAPSGAALVALGITRSLAMVIPLTLLGALGLSTLIEWFKQRWNIPRLSMALPLFVLLILFNFTMLSDALVKGPLWYSDYGLAGMQYGANQLFPAAREYLQEHPDAKLIISPSWSNGTDVVARFYYPEGLPFEMGSILGYFDERKPLNDDTIFVMIPEEIKHVVDSSKFKDFNVEKVLLYPNGEPGFYFVRLKYADNFDEIIRMERERRQQLQEQQAVVAGVFANIKYSFLDMGNVEHLFDGDFNTLVRSFEANPLRVEIHFSKPVSTSAVTVKIGGTATKVDVVLLDADGKVLHAESRELPEKPNPRNLRIDWKAEMQVHQINVHVKSLDSGEPAHVHLWEIQVH
jgi:4-amino-4-deoxy-L-arabinose transferase-like glycosyltransferase